MTQSRHTKAMVSIQFKVPAAVYQSTLSALGALGTKRSETQQAQDVTGTVADVNSRVASAEAAIAQLRKLLTRAGTVGGLLTVQEQINQEEASLEALQSQQRALARETTYATISMTVTGHRHAARARITPARRRPVSSAAWPRAGGRCAWWSPGSSPLPGRRCRSPSRWAWRRWPPWPPGAGWAGAGPPARARRTTGADWTCPGRRLVHQVGDPCQRTGIGLRQHAVAEVEHVPLGHPALVQHAAAPAVPAPAMARAAGRDPGCPAGPCPRPPGAPPRPGRPASPPRRRRRPPPPSGAAVRRCRRRSGCAARPGRPGRRRCAWLCGSTAEV